MIIYNSMIIWILILMLITQNKKVNITYKDGVTRQVVPLSVAILAMGYIAFWPAIRSGIADTGTYIHAFEMQGTGWDAIESAFRNSTKSPFFDWYRCLFKTIISDNYHWWLASITIFTCVPIMITLRKYSNYFLYSMLMFILMLHFTWLSNGVRQFLVAGLLFGCYPYLEKRKPIHWCITIWALSLIHTTVLFAIPMYWFVTEKPFGKKMLLYAGGILIAMVFIGPLLDASAKALSGSAYADNFEQFAEDDGVNPIRVLVMFAPALLAFIKRKEITNFNNDLLNTCVNMSVVSASIYLIGMVTSGIMIGRMPIYFELYNLILFPNLVQTIYPNLKHRLLVGIALCYLAFYWMLMDGAYYISDLTGLIK